MNNVIKIIGLVVLAGLVCTATAANFEDRINPGRLATPKPIADIDRVFECAKDETQVYDMFITTTDEIRYNTARNVWEHTKWVILEIEGNSYYFTNINKHIGDREDLLYLAESKIQKKLALVTGFNKSYENYLAFEKVSILDAKTHENYENIRCNETTVIGINEW